MFQTLFRNHRHLFVVEKGTVRLRPPVKDLEEAGNNHRKRPRPKDSTSVNGLKMKKMRPCWFHANHP